MNKMTKLVCPVALGCAGMMVSVAAHAAGTDQYWDFLTKATQGGVNEIKLSELAETKASTTQVKVLAHRRVVMHVHSIVAANIHMADVLKVKKS